MSTPIRTCVGCRERRPQAALLRVRRLGHGELAPAEHRGASALTQGRSAYLCPDRRCLELAVKRNGLRRAFAREGRVNVNSDGLWSALEESILRRRTSIERSARDPECLPGYRRLQSIEAAMLASRREA
jgi:hypothetical protein